MSKEISIKIEEKGDQLKLSVGVDYDIKEKDSIEFLIMAAVQVAYKSNFSDKKREDLLELTEQIIEDYVGDS